MKNMTLSTTILFLAIIAIPVRSQTPKARTRHDAKVLAAVRAVLDTQRDAWNRGDIAAFMDGYSRSTDTVFVSGDTVTKGWQTVLERYQRTYNSPEKMGTLTFSDLEVTPIGEDAAVVLGRWQLQRPNDQPHGRFTLIFRSTKQGWKIVHDHTSAASS
jgi:uncharacterized protein (TIGR02246 family)